MKKLLLTLLLIPLLTACKDDEDKSNDAEINAIIKQYKEWIVGMWISEDGEMLRTYNVDMTYQYYDYDLIEKKQLI